MGAQIFADRHASIQKSTLYVDHDIRNVLV